MKDIIIRSLGGLAGHGSGPRGQDPRILLSRRLTYCWTTFLNGAELNAVANFCPTCVLPRQVLPVSLNEEDYELYYNGCCNGTFWPLFHSMPDRAIFNEDYWTAYRYTQKKCTT